MLSRTEIRNKNTIVSFSTFLNYYDATYLYLTKKIDAVLITDDNGMKTNAKIENIMTLDSTELRARYSTIFKLSSPDNHFNVPR